MKSFLPNTKARLLWLQYIINVRGQTTLGASIFYPHRGSVRAYQQRSAGGSTPGRHRLNHKDQSCCCDNYRPIQFVNAHYPAATSGRPEVSGQNGCCAFRMLMGSESNITEFRSETFGRLPLVNLDCKHQNGGSVPWMTKRDGYAWEEIKDSLSLSCGSLIISYTSCFFSIAGLAEVINRTFYVGKKGRKKWAPRQRPISLVWFSNHFVNQTLQSVQTWTVLLWLCSTSYQQLTDWGIKLNSRKAL